MSRDLSHLLEPVARRLCGEPSPHSQDDMLHFGPAGSLWVDLAAKTWGDADDPDAGGDVLALVAYRTGAVNGGCEAWLEDHGFTLERPINGSKPVQNGANGESGESLPVVVAPSELFDLDLEQALLAALLYEQDAIHTVPAQLQPEHFYEPLHRRMFDVMRTLAEAGRKVTPITLIPYLPADLMVGEVKISGYVASLASSVTAFGLAPDYAKGVLELGQRRLLETIGNEIIETARSMDAGEPPRAQIAAAVTALTALSSQGLQATQRASTMGAAAKEIVADMGNTEPRQRPTSTGLKELDRVIGGYRRGALYILAARPGMGKSTLAGSSGLMLAHQGQGVIYFSMEMTKQQLAARLISDQAFRYTDPLLYQHILDQQYPKDDHPLLVRQAARDLENLPLIIDPQPGLSIAEIGVRAQRYIESLIKRGIPTALVVVDHLGKVKRPGRANDNVELGQVTNRTAEIAKELDTCFMMLCQLNREVEKREDARPRLSDLRESGHIEEDADVVLMLYREHYYLSRKAWPEEMDRADTHRQKLFDCEPNLDILVTKNRHGRDGAAKVWVHMGAACVRDKEERY